MTPNLPKLASLIAEEMLKRDDCETLEFAVELDGVRYWVEGHYEMMWSEPTCWTRDEYGREEMGCDYIGSTLTSLTVTPIYEDGEPREDVNYDDTELEIMVDNILRDDR